MNDLSWGSGAPAATVAGEAVQGSQEWLAWRGKGLGSSDAAVLLGWSPWKNISQLLEEKLGLWKPTFGAQQMAAMNRGKELEPKIRYWYEQNIRAGVSFPDGIATHPLNEYLRTSFDGINREFTNTEDGSKGRVIEIKAPNMKDHALAQMGEITEKYVPQCQWHLMVGQVPWGDYISRGSDGTNAVVAFCTDKEMQEELERRAIIFKKHVETRTPITVWERWERPLGGPINLAEPQTKPVEDHPAIADQEVEAIVAEALVAQVEADAATARYEALKERVKKILGGSDRMEKGEAVFGYNTRKGNVDYNVIPELIGLDLEQFRKPPTKVFYFKRR